MRRPGLRNAIFSISLALGFAASVDAAQLVTFSRGHSIVVQGFEKRGNWYYFTLEGGGEMGVPVKQVAQIEEYELPPPSAAAPAPADQSPARAAAQDAPQAEARTGNVAAPGSPERSDVATGESGRPQEPPAQGDAAVQSGDDWRSRVKMSAGRNPAGGGSRKPAGMGGPMGAGRPPGTMNPFNRRPPNKPPQQPTPPQQ